MSPGELLIIDDQFEALDDSWREPLIRKAGWVALFFIVWGCGWHWYATRDELMVLLMVPVAVVAVFTPLLLRFGQGVAANSLIGTTIISMGAVTLLSGGTSIGPLVVSMIAPIFAFMLCGVRFGIFWSAVTFLIAVSLLVALRFGVEFYAPLPIEMAFRGLLGSAPTIILLGAVAAVIFERARNAALSELTKSNAKLTALREDLELSQQRYRRVSELSSDFAYQVTLDQSGILSLDWMTQAVEEITGYPAARLLTLDPKVFVHKDDLDRLTGLWRDVIDGDAVETEFRIVHPVHGVRWLRAGAASMMDEDSGDLQIWGAARDISTEVEQADKTQHQHKLEVLGQLTGGVAHDFNNLLGVITGSLDLLRMQDAVAENQELIDEANQAAEKGAALVSRLLTFSRQQPNRPSALDLNEQVHDLLPLLRRATGESIDVRLEPATEAALIFVDSSQLENTLINLCLNARDAITGSGEVVLRVRGEADTILLDVCDNGNGMSEVVAKRAMEPFFTTKESHSGLGLSTAYGFIKQAGGEIQITSNSDRGTTISLSFPKLQDTLVAGSESAANIQRGSGSVLLVDDQPNLRRIGQASLEALGYEAATVSSAEEAIAYLENTTPFPDAVVSDWILPGDLDGYGLACWIRGIYPKLPVLLVTGFATESLEARGERFPILMKPYTLSQLGNRMHKLMH